MLHRGKTNKARKGVSRTPMVARRETADGTQEGSDVCGSARDDGGGGETPQQRGGQQSEHTSRTGTEKCPLFGTAPNRKNDIFSNSFSEPTQRFLIPTYRY